MRPNVYGELKALIEAAGLSIEGVYAVNFKFNIRDGNVGELTLERYVKDSNGEFVLNELRDDLMAETIGVNVNSVRDKGVSMMDTIGTLMVKIKVDTTDFDREMGRLEGRLEQYEQRMKRIRDILVQDIAREV